MQRRHDPTFYWATRRLPRGVRPAVHALYGFVRAADEIVDGPRPPAERRGAPRGARRLGGASSSAAAAGRSDASGHRRAGRRRPAPRPAARRARRLHGLDAGRLRARADREAAPELDAYMDGTAGSVGRIMAPLLGVPRAPATASGGSASPSS